MATQQRSDIQGLRAVAVLTVIAAHFGVVFLPGGFIGVDVFYVISGYLISGLLYREIRTKGSVSLTAFWSRRARRILPAATAVTVLTVVASMLWLSLIDARQVVVDAIWASLFAANINFAREGTDYFAADLGVSPLQHYWSLAVEEQFYLVWPLLLLGCVGLAHLGRAAVRRVRRRGEPAATGPGGLPMTTVLTVLSVVTVASLIWSIRQTGTDPTSAYFSTLTRGWELGAGALAALVPVSFLRRITHLVMSAVGFFGLSMIIFACGLYDPTTAFPGYAALLPVVGTVLLLLSGAGYEPTVPGKIISVRPMRVIGDWSYSLYLVHWPVLVLAERVLLRELTLAERLAALVLVFALAGLSYHLVEMPFRRGRMTQVLRVPRAMVLYPASLVLVAVAASSSWYWTGLQGSERGNNPPITVAEEGPGGREQAHEATVALVRASVTAARDKLAIPSNLNPDLLDLRDSIADVGECDYTFTKTRQLCPRGVMDGERTVVVTGDSHARAWIPAFDRIAASNGWTAYYLVKSQCTAAHVTVAPLNNDEPFTACTDFQDWVVDTVEEIEPDLVVVASSPPVNGVFDDDGMRYERLDKVIPLLAEGYRQLFDELGDVAERVVLLKDVPRNSDDPATCLSSGEPDLGKCSFTPEERADRLAALAAATARAQGAAVVDPTPWLCYEGECAVVVGGTLTYRDTSHLTTEYAASLAGPLGLKLEMTDSP